MTGADVELTTMTDDDLEGVRLSVLNEQERRVNLAAIPEQIEQLARVYRDGGGDEQALTDALTPEQVAELNRA